MLSEQKVREIFQRWFDTCNTKDMNAIASSLDELATPNFVYHNPGNGALVIGREGFLEMLHGLFNENPDFHFGAPDDVVVQGDKAAIRWLASRSDPASGQRQTRMILNIGHYSGDKVAETWEVAGPWQAET